MTHQVKTNGVPLRVWTDPNAIEPAALAQLRRIASLPWVVSHIAVMPDVHLGKGATVGSVIPMKDAVSPAAVGVDMGCGMLAVRTNLTANDLPESLAHLRLQIEESVPTHQGPPRRSAKLSPRLEQNMASLLAEIAQLRAPIRGMHGRAELQLGTLGGGNHFLELCLDQKDALWAQLHSGSRGLGAHLAEFHMERARRATHNRSLPDPELAVFLAGTPDFQAYRHDLNFAQRYAELNRDLMLARLGAALRRAFPRLQMEEPIHCVHNYLAEECHFGETLLITRKGAIHAPEGKLGIIPGSMGTKSYIVRGKGNPLAFESASHGAGRRMSRGDARKSYSLRDFVEQTAHVECRKDRGLIDESPKAYKKIERVMDEQQDLVEIVEELRPILCVKG
jgi:tRNA-splicing ligase RtcB (3'-phosphate/5'-hydroxy nucleic acid ligase)